jgi:quinol monooxygenase YgiN
MLIRVVRMTFDPASTERFEQIFENVRPRIAAFPGCHGVELARDARYPNIFVTLSRWTDEDALESYRHSDLFRSTWAETRRLFAARPQAHSYVPAGGHTTPRSTTGSD